KEIESRSDEELNYYIRFGSWPQTFPETCICFPDAEQPEVPEDRPEEREAIAAVNCPLHGVRFDEFAAPNPEIPQWIRDLEREHGWNNRLPQYQKAMLASFPENQLDKPDNLPDQNPAAKEAGMKSSESQDIRQPMKQHHEDSADKVEELVDQNSVEEEVSMESSGPRQSHIDAVLEQYRNRFRNP